MGPEKTFENKIKDYIQQENGWHIKFFANKFTKSGIPDILACINGYFLAIEVKAQNGIPDKLQIRQCKLIRNSGGLAFIVYPSAWDKIKKIIHNLNYDTFNKDLPIILK